MRTWLRWVGAWLALMLVACGDGDAVCRAGEQVACACPGGGAGAQRCRDDGSGFDACLCAARDAGAPPDTGSADGGLDAGHHTDAGSDAGGDGARDAGPPGVLVFVDSCPGGCTFTPGTPDDSRIDRSSIVSETVTLSEFDGTAAHFAEIVSCLESLFAPFDIGFTTVDPGSAPHTQLVVAGLPSEAGLPEGIGGVAPFTCAKVDNAIPFAFANLFDTSATRGICELAAQQLASTFGLDHAHYCPDVMTYIEGCGDKSFTDYDAPCGEHSERACQCGGHIQNSHRVLLEVLGPAP